MSFLNQLTEHQRTVIVSLPYRVGLWISDSDASGGNDASNREIQALSNIIHGFAEEMFGSEVMQYIMSETLARKDQWAAWAKNVKTVPEDCRFAIDVLREKAGEKDVNVFRTHLLEIGEAVAMAFHEDEEERSEFKAYLSYIAGKFRKKGRSYRSFRDYLRISVSEHKALSDLASALGTAY